jgi:translation initiation factor IF-2
MEPDPIGHLGIWEGKLVALTRFNQEVKDVATGSEGGVRLENCADLRERDILECLETER